MLASEPAAVLAVLSAWVVDGAPFAAVAFAVSWVADKDWVVDKDWVAGESWFALAVAAASLPRALVCSPTARLAGEALTAAGATFSEALTAIAAATG